MSNYDRQMVKVFALDWTPFFKEPIFYSDDIERQARRMIEGKPYDFPVVRPIKVGSDGVYIVDVYQVITGLDVVLGAARAGIEIIEVEVCWNMTDQQAVDRATHYRDTIVLEQKEKEAAHV